MQIGGEAIVVHTLFHSTFHCHLWHSGTPHTETDHKGDGATVTSHPTRVLQGKNPTTPATKLLNSLHKGYVARQGMAKAFTFVSRLMLTDRRCP